MLPKRAGCASRFAAAPVSAVFAPDDNRILTSSDETARLRDGEGKTLAILRHSGRLVSAVFSPDGRRILTASAGRTARLWDRDGLKKKIEFAARGAG
jgi:WD40 repeat protein